MVGEPRTVARPIELRGAFQIWSGLASQRRYRPYGDLPVLAVWLANPKRDRGAIWSESHGPDRGIDQLRSVSAHNVMDLSRAGFRDPDISLSISTRQECHEFAIAGHGRRLLGS